MEGDGGKKKVSAFAVHKSMDAVCGARCFTQEKCNCFKRNAKVNGRGDGVCANSNIKKHASRKCIVPYFR